jgi:RND family efflux transporter MFP subunit
MSDGGRQEPAYGRRQYDRPTAADLGRRGYDRGEHPPSARSPAEPEPAPESAPASAPAARPADDARPALRPRRLAIGFGAVLLLAGALVGLLLWHQHHALRTDAARRQRDQGRGPRLFVAEVRAQPGARELTLPADVRGFLQATVYAKVAGYVKSIVVDKGDPVKKGQLLGLLESPEVDQQVAAAQADLVIKRRTFERYRQLVAKDFVSAQDFETARAQYGVSQATLRQMRALQGYKVLRAPFAGTVTARYVDPGALVPAATGSTQAAQPLVDVADLGRLRVLVFVQQDAAPFLRAGDPVTIAIDQRPDLKIAARVTRISQALDPRSRAMLCEIWLDNTYHLYPGTFVHVTLRLETPSLPMIPSSALVIHGNRPSVAVIRDDRVHFVAVRPGVDDGRTVQVLEGLKAGDRVAVQIPAEIADGAVVEPVEQKQAPAASPAAPR